VLIKPSTLPRTTSGKIRRATCREALLKQSLPVLHAWFERSLESRPLEAP
jgi:acyl-CoA synthetase (AMP-forming)/AMP-acid ligase II